MATLPATGSYVIHPKVKPAASLFINVPTTPTVPPSADIPVTLATPVVPLSWYVKRGAGNVMNVYLTSEDTENFKWINTGNVLYASITNPTPGTFALAAAGGGYYNIGLPGQNLLLTVDTTSGAVTFKPGNMNNADSQRFLFTAGTIPGLPGGGIP